MKYLVEIKDKHSSITLLTESHEEAMDMYNSNKETKESKFTILSDKKFTNFMEEMDREVYLVAPYSLEE